MTVGVRNEISNEFFVGYGRLCPKCQEKVYLTFYRDENKIIGKCKSCGRSYDEKFTQFQNECSCGCGHLSLSVVIGDTWYNVMSTCKCVDGKYKMHTVRRKTIQ